MDRRDRGWLDPEVASVFLERIRAAIPYATEQLDVMARLIEANGGAGSLLDLGSGAGALSERLLARWPGARATLVDFSEKMLSEARRRLGDKGLEARFVKADFGQSPWLGTVARYAPFDAVVSGYAIHHQSDDRKKELYSEILGLLRPGGIFINIEHVSSASQWVKAVAEGVFLESLRSLGAGDGERAFLARPDNEMSSLASAEEQCGWLREARYSDVDIFFKAYENAVFGGRRP